ncbi:ROK family protein [Radiobacillus sp. PE A8.2]|uniref:ROK family protein n=1 Tax=Radiobacillus sp. PE A8.2 TaxID=3380349 RepID=UPI0038900CE5
MKKFLAFDVGGTFIKYGIVTEDAEILEKGKVKTPKALEELLEVINQFAKQFRDVEGIAISCPGAVSDEGIIYGSSAIPYIHGPNIKQLIVERTGLPVYMENDANCAGYAEVWNGSAKGKQDVLVMVIGTGIGGAVIKDGLLHKGNNLHGGEFGYMLLTSDYTSSDDVWSRVASMKALIKSVAKAKNVDFETLSGEEIFELAEAGDTICIDAVDRFYHLLAIGIYNLQYIYDPEVILIGGGVSAREDLIDKINGKLSEILDVIKLAKIRPVIDTCMFRQDANLLGAVYGFMKVNN